jgi:FKBP-type peptidyl-prolyl cis-trans isomerase
MKRLVLAIAALAISACTPPTAVDANNPWTALQPWDHARADVQKLPSGVEYVIVRKGDGQGAKPGPRDMVEVKYEGRLAENGLVFDSSYERGDTAKFRLNTVIPGWTDGLQHMQPGDMFMFWIPYAQAYGERGQGMQIPPRSDLMFQVELIKAVADPWAKVAPWPTDSSQIVRRPSGLEYMVVESGPEGASPTEADEVAVHFEGRNEAVMAEEGDTADDLRNRSIVASTYDEGQPKFFPVKDVVPGWNEVLKLMRKGDRWMVRMPSQLLYGSEGDGRIPPDGTVIYELELLDFAPASPMGPPPRFPPQ